MHSKPRWPVVLFDLDGTLVNSIDAIVTSYIFAWDTVAGRQVTRAEVLPWIGRTLSDVFGEQAPEHADELEQVYMDYKCAHLEALVTSFDGVPELVHDMVAAGIRTGVVTSQLRRSTIPVMKIAGLPEETVLACAADDTTRHKPDPAPLLTGLKVLGAPVEGSLYVGDAVYDLKAASAAGMDAIGVTWGAGIADQLRAQPHVAVVDSVDQLRALLLG